jgi:hypothetical protein
MWMTWPQLAFAVMGGLFAQNFGLLGWMFEARVPPDHVYP